MSYSPFWKYHRLIKFAESDLEESKTRRQKQARRSERQWAFVLTIISISLFMNIRQFSVFNTLNFVNLSINLISIIYSIYGIRRAMLFKKQGEKFISLYSELITKVKNIELEEIKEEADFQKFVEGYAKDYESIQKESQTV